MMFDVKNISQILNRCGVSLADDCIGVTEADLVVIEEKFCLKLPLSYKEFLLISGMGIKGRLTDVDFFYPALLDFREELEEMLEDEEEEIEIPIKAFVFSAYQGFQFHYFICDGTDDPAVYRVMDGGSLPELVATSFSKYLEKALV